MASFGLFGNCLSILVFQKKKFQRNFHQLMSFLALYDLLYIILALTLFSLPQLVGWEKWKQIFIKTSESSDPPEQNVQQAVAGLAASGSHQPDRWAGRARHGDWRPLLRVHLLHSLHHHRAIHHCLSSILQGNQRPNPTTNHLWPSSVTRSVSGNST